MSSKYVESIIHLNPPSCANPFRILLINSHLSVPYFVTPSLPPSSNPYAFPHSTYTTRKLERVGKIKPNQVSYQCRQASSLLHQTKRSTPGPPPCNTNIHFVRQQKTLYRISSFPAGWYDLCTTSHGCFNPKYDIE